MMKISFSLKKIHSTHFINNNVLSVTMDKLKKKKVPLDQDMTALAKI
jgi:hypothetical protein